MSRSFRLSRVAVVATCAALSLVACDDYPTGSLSAPFVSQTPAYELRLDAELGDTLDFGPQMLVAASGEEIRCESANPSVIAVVDGSARMMAAGSGEVLVSCVVTRAAEPGELVSIVEIAAAHYQVSLTVW
jgi:hypothetical protein